MKPEIGPVPCQTPACGCSNALDRRSFLRLAGLGGAGLVAVPWRPVAGPFNAAEFEKLVPADKKLSPEWVKSLFARGAREVYSGTDLAKIGMPIGGLCAGQLYLGGDGKLWHWDIFNQVIGTGDSHYAKPVPPSSPLEQGFALRLTAGGKPQVRPLDHTGWKDITFRGEYPIGYVEYRDPDVPVTVSLEAFSPFIPLNTEDSALPATVMHFTVRNTSATKVAVELAGWLENAACLHSALTHNGQRRNCIVRRGKFTFLECHAETAPETKREARRADILFEDFEKETYEGWTVTGTAFGNGPVEKARMPAYQGEVGAQGRRLVNTHNTRQGEDVGRGDAHTGTLTSRSFVIERDYITFLIGGGAHQGKTCINLLVDNQVVRSATGRNDNRMQPQSFDVRQWAGRPARLQIVDKETGGWGNIGIDDIVFSDQPRTPLTPLAEAPDLGTMGLALLDDQGVRAYPAVNRAQLPAISPAKAPPGTSAAPHQPTAQQPFGERLVGALAKQMTLRPGQAATVTFVLAWHFPNLKLEGLRDCRGRWYGKQFANALAVAGYIAAHFHRLQAQTRLWHDTWYDSTLPYWFLDRTFLTASVLATNTCYWFGNGRFYGWEGVGCCAGTCTHVWHYAQAVARLFPTLERSLREIVDYGLAFDPATGRIRFRAEHNDHWAVDGQAGVILRTWREHQMCADAQFLSRVWPRAKQALEFLIAQDTHAEGVIEGPQHNTLDADWFGRVAWLSGLYLAALSAGEQMAGEMGDSAFASQCRKLLELGRRQIDEQLFNGEYYVQLPDEARRKTVGSYDGCEIDQVFGQSWAWQVGLGRLLDAGKTKTALRSLWRYNFTPDVGPYRNVYKPGRWYAMPGEGGLLMCTWPRGEAQRVKESFDYYFNECMTGFEYQVAGHMLWEEMLLEGLAITRAIHDRYHPARRNPWNEVECGDHYARSMAGYGVFLAACGFTCHGPKGHLGFAPRLNPDNFKCAFTTAQGWGTYCQQSEISNLKSQLTLKWGKLRLRTLALQPAANLKPTKVSVKVAGKVVPASLKLNEKRAEIEFGAGFVLQEGQRLEVTLS
jgi:uncharacterized protein (DUF608 family)